jgi:hypothetical protein
MPRASLEETCTGAGNLKVFASDKNCPALFIRGAGQFRQAQNARSTSLSR